MDTSTLISGGTMLTLIGYIISIERRLTKLATNMSFIMNRMKCLYGSGDEV